MLFKSCVETREHAWTGCELNCYLIQLTAQGTVSSLPWKMAVKLKYTGRIWNASMAP